MFEIASPEITPDQAAAAEVEEKARKIIAKPPEYVVPSHEYRRVIAGLLKLIDSLR